MKEYEILYRMKWNDYPEYEQVFAEDDYEAVVKFFENIIERTCLQASDFEIIKMEVL